MKKLKEFFQRFVSPETSKYDLAIVGLILFILVWGAITYHSPHSNPIVQPVVIPVTNRIETFTVSPKETVFVEGEFVGVRYFEVFGVISSKKLQIGGYIYEVTYKDRGGILNKIEVDKSMLFHPTQNDLLLHALHN